MFVRNGEGRGFETHWDYIFLLFWGIGFLMSEGRAMSWDVWDFWREMKRRWDEEAVEGIFAT